MSAIISAQTLLFAAPPARISCFTYSVICVVLWPRFTPNATLITAWLNQSGHAAGYAGKFPLHFESTGDRQLTRWDRRRDPILSLHSDPSPEILRNELIQTTAWKHRTLPRSQCTIQPLPLDVYRLLYNCLLLGLIPL